MSRPTVYQTPTMCHKPAWGALSGRPLGQCRTQAACLAAAALAEHDRRAGLLGGHSGLNIGEDRGNAVIMAAQLVEAVLKAVPAARLAAFQGGDKRNALAREASALLLVRSACWSLLLRLQDCLSLSGGVSNGSEPCFC